LETLIIFQRNIKWRFQNPITIIMTLLQPLIWLLLYSSLFAGTMEGHYRSFILAGILMLVVFISAGMSAVANYVTKQNGSFYRIHISPVRRSSIVMGHILDAAVLSFIEIAILLVLAHLMSVRIASGITGLGLMAVLLFTAVFLVAAFSYLLSLVLPDENAFYTLMNTLILPVFFLSTALIPLERIPKGLRRAVAVNPFTRVIDSLRNLIMTPAVDWSQYGAALFVMVVPGILFFCLSVRRLQRDGRQQ